MAPIVVKTEIWETITRRGVLGNLLMGIIPMLFYLWLNALALALETASFLLPRRMLALLTPKTM